ncbi:NADH-quinone oxidoreductase subunit H [Myxococcota bacterium]|nr:NADH-quinone oxidoreductase subunit H [Myxococcota bacterium]MBU1431162.1 NADH-quinone oxidoreductase subunit H [Myxococcota bacterium]MBU1896651.1 NADH-quinone oxidoreductase subunit H [Myxococcota bacterium]
MDTLLHVIVSLISLMVALAYGLTTGGVVRKIMARIQGRIGPPVYQPFIDLGKVLFLRTGTHHGVMFILGPVFRLAGAAGFYLLIPVIVGVPFLEGFHFSGDLLLVMYFMFFGSLGMALGAADGGHPHSPIGVGRGLAQMTAYELPFGLAVVAIVASSGSFSVFEIVEHQRAAMLTKGVLGWNLFQLPFASIAAFLALLGMNMYPPFNIVGAPTEIPVGPATEYNTAFQSLQMSGRAIFAIAKVVLFMNLFLGGAHSILEAFIKTFFIYMWSIFVGAVFPRFRPEQSIRFFLGWPTAAGVLAVALILWR